MPSSLNSSYPFLAAAVRPLKAGMASSAPYLRSSELAAAFPNKNAFDALEYLFTKDSPLVLENSKDLSTPCLAELNDCTN